MEEKPPAANIKVYKRRWWMLGIFIAFSASNAFQWAQYAVVENVIVDYYQINPLWIEWTALSYAFNLTFLILPTAWILEKYGMRNLALIASWLNAGGATLKIFSSSRDSFAIAFVGQWMVAVGQLGYFPSRVAALWFGKDEISTACSLGIFGNQIGVAIGFLLPPMIIKMNEDKAVTGEQITFVNYLVAGACIVVHGFIYFCFEDAPKLAPSKAALERNKEKVDFKGTLSRLIKHRGYLYLLFVYGTNMGVFCAVTTLLNRIVLTYFPDATEHIGRIGLVTLICGIVGSIWTGVLLDKIGRYADVSLAISIGGAVTSLSLCLVVDKGSILLVYVVYAGIGFFMTGYFTVGFETAAEITYPENEGTTSGILNGVTQSFAIAATMFGSWLIQQKGVLWCCYFFFFTMLAGSFAALKIPKDYKRTAVASCGPVERKIENEEKTDAEIEPLKPINGNVEESR
ncbi:Major Facilitator Superfamily [Nesidiocoris tenuis]|uniref:Major Facilitator Superfamily n=1 Tax=Nesidiocoris tenuis TaxID=355587 RepID=A0ABN7B6F3_9HEMI|nr:Major Facilitator Superfamily [Nesidiocoris tenuis]